MAKLVISREKLLERRQALTRQGLKPAFTFAIKPSNTPQGAVRHHAKYLQHYDPQQRKAEKIGVPLKKELTQVVPPDILEAHSAYCRRMRVGLRPDSLVRAIPTLDIPKPRQRVVIRRAPDGLTLIERKLWKKMGWYKPGFSNET